MDPEQMKITKEEAGFEQLDYVSSGSFLIEFLFNCKLKSCNICDSQKYFQKNKSRIEDKQAHS